MDCHLSLLQRGKHRELVGRGSPFTWTDGTKSHICAHCKSPLKPWIHGVPAGSWILPVSLLTECVLLLLHLFNSTSAMKIHSANCPASACFVFQHSLLVASSKCQLRWIRTLSHTCSILLVAPSATTDWGLHVWMLHHIILKKSSWTCKTKISGKLSCFPDSQFTLRGKKTFIWVCSHTCITWCNPSHVRPPQVTHHLWWCGEMVHVCVLA